MRPKKDGGFSFCVLESFNISLLGKMVARVLSELDSLWVRVLKGLYFPYSTFLQVEKGSKASWAWTSLLSGQDLVRNAGDWSLGDGKKIQTS